MSKEKETKQVNDVKVEKQTSETLPLEELSEEQIEFARISLREEFNKKYSKWAEIAEEKADDDFIAEAKKDLEDAADYVGTRKYLLADASDGVALRTAEFLKEWNDKFNHWERAEWRGIIVFNKVIEKHIAELKADANKPFEIDYATLIFLYNCMRQPSGTGLESARLIARFENYDEATEGKIDEDTPVTYSGVLERVLNYIHELTAYDKKLKILKQRYDFALGTAKMILKIDSVEEFVEFHEEITKSILPEDDEELKKTLDEAANS